MANWDNSIMLVASLLVRWTSTVPPSPPPIPPYPLFFTFFEEILFYIRETNIWKSRAWSISLVVHWVMHSIMVGTLVIFWLVAYTLFLRKMYRRASSNVQYFSSLPGKQVSPITHVLMIHIHTIHRNSTITRFYMSTEYSSKKCVYRKQSVFFLVGFVGLRRECFTFIQWDTASERKHRDKGVSGKLKVLQRVAKSHNMMRSIFSHKILSGLVCAIFGWTQNS